MASFQNLLLPQTLTSVISQKAAVSDWLTATFGVAPGGKNVHYEGHGRTGFYHVYDHVRTVAQGRTPGTAAARRAINPMGRVTFTYPRMHDSMSMPAEWLHNLGQISNPAMRDAAGADMIRRQTDTLGEMAANWRKVQLIGALRDSLYMVHDGDNTYFTFTDPGNGVRVNYQMPAGNKSQLDMLGDGNIIDVSWANAASNIPLHLMKINAGFQSLCGGHLSTVICRSAVWNYVIQNTAVKAIHGTSNAPFNYFARDAVETELAKTMKNVFKAKLNIMPDVDWYITDEVIELGQPGSETVTNMVGENNAIFCGTEPGDGKALCMYESGEPIAEYDGGPEEVKVGLNAWSVKRSNPTATEIYTLDNALVINYIPKANAYGTVVF
jgi:hypothetical protein